VQSIELLELFLFGQLNPPSVPAFLSPLRCGKKSFTQVGLRVIQRKKFLSRFLTLDKD
jgi:hypothetical protein